MNLPNCSNEGSTKALMFKHGSMSNHTSLQNQTYIKRLLRDAKDQATTLQLENNRLKKTVKYT